MRAENVKLMIDALAEGKDVRIEDHRYRMVNGKMTSFVLTTDGWRAAKDVGEMSPTLQSLFDIEDSEMRIISTDSYDLTLDDALDVIRAGGRVSSPAMDI